MVLIVQEIS